MPHATRIDFETFAGLIVLANEDHLLNEGPDEQIRRAADALTRFTQHTPLSPAHDREIDLAGFGSATVCFTSSESGEPYVLLSTVAEQLGLPIWKACTWARDQHLWAIEDQRSADEERGDGRLGWDCLRELVNLHLDFIADDPEANPDANGRRWSSYGDWLISRQKILPLLMVSPWGQVFFNNAEDHLAISFRKAFGDCGGLFTPTLPDEEQALRRAVRGPVFDPEDLPE